MEQLIFGYTGIVGSFTLEPGKYLFECWGAGSIGAAYGGYSRGEIYLESKTTFYHCIGSSIGIFNGNAYSGGNRYMSGGATDIRLVGGNWNEVSSLRSRIMVAGGAGSPGAPSYAGGHGGGLSGNNGSGSIGSGGTGATLTAGGSYRGDFGLGGYGGSGSGGYGGAGGGGYWGGGGTNVDSSADDDKGGGGGSGFISGMPGCISVAVDGTNSGSPFHYSGLSFTNAKMEIGVYTSTVGKIIITTLEKETTDTSGVYTKVNGEWVAGTI